MAEGPGLVIKVLQVTGIPSSAENDASDVYCILSTGTCRFTCRSLPVKRNSTPWPESFLLSPADIRHASQRITPSSTKIPSGANMTADANTPTGPAGSSPVLTIELWSSKRWGADSMTTSGELLLAPYLSTLEPGGPAVQVRVALKNPKATSKAANKAGRSVTPAAADVSTSSSPGLDSGWVLGAEVQCMVLELTAVAPPKLPVNLLGPVGSGRAEVPPSYSYSTSWLSPQRPTLHTSAGHLYQTPTVQMLKITLHRAQGLQNLHVDPHAAAAAAAAISKLTVVGEAPTRAERARIAATNAVLESKVGRTLINKTNSWFHRNRPPSLAAVGSAVVATGPIAQSSRSQTPNSRSQTPLAANPNVELAGATAAAADSSGGAAFDGAPALPLTVSAAGPLLRQDSPCWMSTPAAAAGGKDSPQAAAAAQAVPVAASPYIPGGDLEDSSSSSNLPPSASPGLSVPPVASAGTVVAAVIDDDGDDGVDPLGTDLIAVDSAAADADPDFDLSEYEFNLEDPVSRLQQATQHQRKASVDAEAVMAALEENGFHATDAPGGAYVYARLNVSPYGDSLVSRVVGLRAASGEAVWEQSFWVAVTRPAPAGSSLEVELFASKDDKSRGRSVAVLRVPLHQLLQQPQQSSKAASHAGADGSTSTAWFKASHTLPASISDHLHCSVHVTVEAADWDSRAELAHIARAIQPDAISTNEPGSLAYQQRLLGSSSPGSGASSPTGSPRKAVAAKLLAQHTNVSAGLERSGSPVPGLQQQQQRQDSLGSNAGSVQGSTSAGITNDSQEAVTVTPPPPIANLDVVVKAFETRKPLDVFFVLLIGPYCVVSSTSHSTHHHSWGWHLNMEVTQPADMMTLALFAREDQAGGKRKVGASMLTMFSSSIRLVGKMRVRLTTLTANTPMNVSMPLQGERTNLRGGRPAAAVAHLYFHLQVPQLFGSYLRSYFKYTASSPGLYLLANKRGRDSRNIAQEQRDSSLDVLAMQAEQTTARWLESQPPSLSWKVFRKVQDDGRLEFTLSRTRSNWRRLILLRESLAPARAMFEHLCSWENYLHSGACYCVILLFGMYPSKALAVLLLWICIAIARAAANTKGHNTQLSSGKQPTSSSQPVAAAAAIVTSPPLSAVTAPGPPSAAGGLPGVFQRVMPARPPPNMTDPGLSTAEEQQQQQQQQQQGSAVVTDAYTSMKQNYEGLVLFLTTVQNVVDGWAAAGERTLFAFSWSDQLATTVLLVILLVLAVGLWVLGLRVLVTIGLLWVFRHPVLRDPLPPPPANFMARMPTRSDTMM